MYKASCVFKIKFSHSNLKHPCKIHPTCAYLPSWSSLPNPGASAPFSFTWISFSVHKGFQVPAPEHSISNLSQTQQTGLLFAPVNRGLLNPWVILPWKQGEIEFFNLSSISHTRFYSVCHLSASVIPRNIKLWNELQQVSSSVIFCCCSLKGYAPHVIHSMDKKKSLKDLLGNLKTNI